MEYEVITDCAGKVTTQTFEDRREAKRAYEEQCTFYSVAWAMLVVRYETGRTKTLEAFGDC